MTDFTQKELSTAAQQLWLESNSFRESVSRGNSTWEFEWIEEILTAGVGTTKHQLLMKQCALNRIGAQLDRLILQVESMHPGITVAPEVSVDWNDDRAVVCAHWHRIDWRASRVWKVVGQRIYGEDSGDTITLLGKDWAEARQHPDVKQWEEKHRPKT